MPEYLDDPSVLTKDKLKSELVANNVELPSGNPTKDVFVQLYLKNLTVQNKKNTTLDAFSSDEELPPPVVSNRSRSSGRKATRKTDKARPEDLDVTELTAEGLKDELLKYGVDVGPIVASTRKLYEKKLQKLLDQGPPQPLVPHVVLAEIDANHNGNSDSDRYSDKEEEETALPEPEPEPEPVPEPEPEPVPEPAPVVERPVRSRGKTPVTTRTRSSQHNRDVPIPGIPHCKSKIVSKDLRPVLTDQVQAKSNSTVHHSRVSPAKTESPSLNSRPAKGPAGAALSCAVRERCVALKPRHSPPAKTPVNNNHPEDHRAPESPRWKLHEEGVGIPPPKLLKASPRQPVALLNTTLLEEPQPNVKASVGQSVTPLRPVALSLPEEPSLWLAAKPSGPSPSLVHLSQIDPITFSPMCDISPIKDQESHWSLSGRFESKASGGSAVAEKQGPSDTQLRKGRQQKITPFLSTLSPVKTHGCMAVVSKEPQFKEVEKIAAGDQTPRVEERNVLKEMFPNEINTPTGINATCRRPIRGAAGRPVKSSDLWNDENFLRSAKSINTTTTTSSYTESRSVHRVTNMPPSTPSSSASSSSSRLVSAAPPTGQTKAARRSLSLWIKLFLLAVVAAFLFFVYQAMETNAINPFGGWDTEQTSSDSAEKVASK